MSESALFVPRPNRGSSGEPSRNQALNNYRENPSLLADAYKRRHCFPEAGTQRTAYC
jgi:hypothetical protein